MTRALVLAGLLALAACDSASPLSNFVAACTTPVPLTAAEIETIIAQAAARAAADGNAYHITVVNREGVVGGEFLMDGAAGGLEASTRSKARTAAFLSSHQHAFNTRTARFIIQDNFPPGIANAPGGPLYGVQFSSLACSDIVGETAGTVFTSGNGLSGDFGSMPLYKGGCLVGAVAVDGGPDDSDEERAAWGASAGFRPDVAIFGSNIFIDGVRLAFVNERPADLAAPPFGSLLGAVLTAPAAAPPETAFPTEVIAGITVEVFVPIIDSPLGAITEADVRAMFSAGVALAERTRAGIRRPLGVAARVFICVTDLDGNVLGCVRTPEATLFSFDVAIQKARTAAFFSSDTAAITTRALGFLAQGFFPPGIASAPEGPLHGLQDAINPGCVPAALPLQNGITIFPGGVPLYKGGVLVGAIGVSGDGVDQDDFVASAGADLFPPPTGIRGDELAEADAVAALRARIA
ncbi:MAG: heme-binding protein, partial [Planctomycetota bacterium]|nr:heme-binding protein [Planctomycetota bacterium]